MTNFKRTIFSLVAMFLTVTSLDNLASSYAATQIDGGYLERSENYSKDFKAHFGGYIHGLKQILNARDHRKSSWFYSSISNERDGPLQTFLRTTQRYGRGYNGDEIPDNATFWTEYTKATGRGKVTWIATEMHHIIPRDLNGPNDAWNFVQLTPNEHNKISNFITLIGALNGKTLKTDRAWIEDRLRGRYNAQTISDYLNWLKLSH